MPGFRALPRHSLEDKAAAIAALTGVHGWAVRGARLRKGGFGRGTGSFHGNVPGAERERDKARSLLAGPREPGWKIPREEVVVLCWVLYHALFSSSPAHS